MSELPIPILITGRTEQIGRMVTKFMQPEYEVIHFTLSNSIADELPFLLTGLAPPNPSSTIGSGNWSSAPQALLFGGAYRDQDIDDVVKLAETIKGAARIPWVRLDGSKMEMPPANPTEEEAKAYGLLTAKRMKDFLERLRKEGKLGEGNGTLHLV